MSGLHRGWYVAVALAACAGGDDPVAPKAVEPYRLQGTWVGATPASELLLTLTPSTLGPPCPLFCFGGEPVVLGDGTLRDLATGEALALPGAFSSQPEGIECTCSSNAAIWATAREPSTASAGAW